MAEVTRLWFLLVEIADLGPRTYIHVIFSMKLERSLVSVCSLCWQLSTSLPLMVCCLCLVNAAVCFIIYEPLPAPIPPSSLSLFTTESFCQTQNNFHRSTSVSLESRWAPVGPTSFVSLLSKAAVLTAAFPLKPSHRHAPSSQCLNNILISTRGFFFPPHWKDSKQTQFWLSNHGCIDSCLCAEVI